MNRYIDRLRRGLVDGEDGLSLVEMMIAILVIAVAIMALMSVSLVSLVSTREARDRQQATDAASSALEIARSYSYDETALTAAQVNPATDPFLTVVGGKAHFDHDGSGPEPSEPVIVQPTGSVTREQTVDRYTVYTYVTWFDPDGTGAQGSRRVTTIVRWDDEQAGELNEVRESTVVAEANRGLAAPKFAVSPDAFTVTEQAGQILCFDHSLINQGERDKHDFRISSLGWVGGVNQVIGPASWKAHATLATPPAAPEQFTDQNSDLRPDSTMFLERRATLPLQVCYDIPAGIANGTTFSWTAEFRSAFDSTVTRTVTHNITIGTPAGGGGPPPPGGGSTHPGLFMKYTSADSGARTFALNTDVPTRASLPNYDVPANDGDGLPGWKLEKGSLDNNKNRSRWDWQYTGNGNVTLNGQATMRFYSAWSDALKSGKTDPKKVEYRIQVQVLNSSKNVLRTLTTKNHVYTHNQGDWMLQTVSFDFSGLNNNQRKVGSNEYVRFQVLCEDDNGGEVDCHMAFDALVSGGPRYTSAIQIGGVT